MTCSILLPLKCRSRGVESPIVIHFVLTALTTNRFFEQNLNSPFNWCCNPSGGNIVNKAFRERRHPSAPRSVNEQPIHWPTGWKLIYLPCTVAHKEAHCASNIVSNSHLFHSKPIKLPIPKIWLLKIWPWKYKVKVRGEVKVLSHNLGLTSYQIVLEIPTGPLAQGRQLWRRTGNFLLIFIQFNVYDLRFKPWGPTTFWLSFQHCILWIHILVCQSTLLFLW